MARPLTTADFYLAQLNGNWPNQAYIVQKFGRNPSVGNGVWEGVLQAADNFYFPPVAAPVRVRGGNAADDGSSSPLGAGAHVVTVQGLDENGEQAEENIILKGATASDYTTTNFLRVFRAWVAECGTYVGNNTGNIVIENAEVDPVGVFITILAEEGQTQYAAYSIPAGWKAIMLSATVDADASKPADFALFTRGGILESAPPYSAKRLKHYWDGVIGHSELKTVAPHLLINELTDIWIEAQGGGADTEVSANFELLVFKE